MEPSTFDSNTLILVVAILGPTLTIISLMYRQFSHLDKKLDVLNTRVGNVETTIAPIDARFDAFESRFDARFDAFESRFDARFDAIESRFDARFDAIETRFETRFDGVDARFDGVDARFDKLDARFDAMGRDVSDARERLARIEGHLMGPESFQARGHGSPAPDEPALERPDADQP